MNATNVLKKLKLKATKKTLNGMSRYGIPNDHAIGVTMGDMKYLAKQLGTDHDLAQELWKTGLYEARTVAVFLDDPAKVEQEQMESWANDFDNWAICGTTCFHLFDKTPDAWLMVRQWANSEKEFVRRAAFAMIWALSVHDKTAPDKAFSKALELIEEAADDERLLVKKGIDMALRATGKRNLKLHKNAITTAKRMSLSSSPSRAWIGEHALRELQSDKVLARLS